MPLLSSIFAMLIALGTPQSPVENGAAQEARRPASGAVEGGSLSARAPEWPGFEIASQPEVARQVRIERRVILRISPQPSDIRRGALSQLSPQAIPPRLVERPFARCIDAADIVGVSSERSRLVMYMRDRKILTAELEKACTPRDFYLGFYVERSEDGKLCVDRDRLLSRAGAKCRISRLNRLVAASDSR